MQLRQGIKEVRCKLAAAGKSVSPSFFRLVRLSLKFEKVSRTMAEIETTLHLGAKDQRA